LAQQGGDAAGVLRSDPIELEAVGHHHPHAGKVIADRGLQGFYPGVELLFGEFLGQLINAGLPEGLPSIGLVRGRCRRCHVADIAGDKLWIDSVWERISGTLSKNYPQIQYLCG
jgi:hypothetical protein